jgi:hypothetical protein
MRDLMMFSTEPESRAVLLSLMEKRFFSLS